MIKGFLHETANIKDSKIGIAKVYRNVCIYKSVLADGCSIGDDTIVERCKLDSNVIINRRSYVNDSIVGKYTYMGINTTMNFTRIGKFCSIGRNVDIGGFNHDYNKVTTMPEFRFKQMLNGGGQIPQNIQSNELCEIGNDVWIAAGASILHKVKIGNGAVIGAVGVVTKDVPAYAIVVGVPARIIGYRCEKSQIESLEQIRWWDWPEETIIEVMDELMNRNINDETIEFMKTISQGQKLEMGK